MTSSVVNTYIIYLSWDAMTNDSNLHCNSWDNAQDTAIGIIIGLVVVGITLGYVCFRKREKIAEQTPIRVVAELILAKDNPEEDEELYDLNFKGKKILYFHLFMALVSIYMSMVLTNWGSANTTNNNSKTYNK